MIESGSALETTEPISRVESPSDHFPELDLTEFRSKVQTSIQAFYRDLRRKQERGLEAMDAEERQMPPSDWAARLAELRSLVAAVLAGDGSGADPVRAPPAGGGPTA